MNKMSKVSYRFSLLFRLFFISYPLYVLVVWLGGIDVPNNAVFTISRMTELQLSTTPFIHRVYACLVLTIPTAFVMMSFYYLQKLFQLYSKGIIFSYQNVICIRKVGFAFIWQVISFMLVQPAITLIATIDAPAGGHIIGLSFTGDEMTNLIVGGVILLISWVMEEGSRLQEETSLTV